MIVFKYINGCEINGIINKLLCGVWRVIFKFIEIVLVVVLFNIDEMIICIGFVVMNGNVFLEIKYKFNINEVLFVLCWFVVNLEWVRKFVIVILIGGIIFVVIIVVIGIYCWEVIKFILKV